MYFHSLAVFAFAACATFVSAAPRPSNLELVAARASAELAVAMREVAVLPRDDVPAVSTPDAPATPDASGAVSSPADILKDMTTKLTPIVKELKGAVADVKALNQDKIVGYLNDIADILTEAKTELQTVAASPLETVTSLLVLGNIFTTLGPFLQLVFSVLALVLQVVADTPLGPVVQPLLNTVAGLLGEILALVVSLLPGIVALLSPILAILSPVLHTLGLDSVLSIINIPGLTL